MDRSTRLHPISAQALTTRLRERAEREPSAVALRVADGPTLRFADWLDAADAHAAQLRHEGIGAGGRVGLLFENTHYAEYAVVWVAVLMAGATVVPLAADAGPERLRLCAEQAAISLLVHAAASAPPDLGVPTAGGACPPRVATREAHPTPRDERIAEILFTSGTTGPPRAIAVSHASIARELAEDERRHAGEKTLHSVPLASNWGQQLLRAALASHTEMIVLPRFHPRRAIAEIVRERPTELALPPALALTLLAAATPADDLSSVRKLSLSAAPITPAGIRRLHERFDGATVKIGYTSTEAWPAQTVLRYPPDPPTTVGRPAAGTELRLVAEDGRACLPGDVGEVQLRGPADARRAYLEETDAAEGAFLPDGWVATGDLGTLDAVGRLTLKDRAAAVVNVGGTKVYTPEVEAVLSTHPGVSDVAVFGLGDELLGEQVAAAVVLSRSLDVELLREHARSRLPAHKVPQRLAVVEQLPLGPTGKADKDELRRLLTASDDDPGDIGPLEVEALVLRAWQSALDVEQLAPDDDLFEHGATSLDAFGIVARLSEQLGVAVPAGSFLARFTAREQSELVAALLPAERTKRRS